MIAPYCTGLHIFSGTHRSLLGVFQEKAKSHILMALLCWLTIFSLSLLFVCSLTSPSVHAYASEAGLPLFPALSSPAHLGVMNSLVGNRLIRWSALKMEEEFSWFLIMSLETFSEVGSIDVYVCMLWLCDFTSPVCSLHRNLGLNPSELSRVFPLWGRFLHGPVCWSSGPTDWDSFLCLCCLKPGCKSMCPTCTRGYDTNWTCGVTCRE